MKLIYVEAFPKGKLDGSAMIVGETPLIGISGRGKRLDKALFTILHETAHVLLGHVSTDGVVIVDDLSEAGQDEEGVADRLAGELAILGPLPAVVENYPGSRRAHCSPTVTDHLERWTAFVNA